MTTFNCKTQPGLKPLAIVYLCCLITASAAAKDTSGKIDPTQTLTYWKPHIITSAGNNSVTRARTVFHTLLRSWDRGRVAPQLYVVKSGGGPWAASLADGNIILSNEALEACNQFGSPRSEHLIAFVLAHELAHQRADDLWHQKFIRLAESQTPEVRQQLFRGLKIDSETITDLAEREAQADHDGIIIMSSVGYDPYQVVGQRDFFTAWVEQIWESPCSVMTDNQHKMESCAQAKTRALRTRSQLSNIAAQTTLYHLGMQAYMANDHDTAKHYFLAYGKHYPSRAVFTSLGLNELARATVLRDGINAALPTAKPAFHYPLVMDVSPEATPINTQLAAKRSSIDITIQQKSAQLKQHIKDAVVYLQQAIQLEPDHPDSYLYLAMAYLLDENTYMARGILQGQYIPRFKTDPAVELLIALTSALEGKIDQAQQQLDLVLNKAIGLPAEYDRLTKTALVFSGFYNAAELAAHANETGRYRNLWQRLATLSKTSGNSLLFRMALLQLNKDQQHKDLAGHLTGQALRPAIYNHRLGDRLDISVTQGRDGDKPVYEHRFWLNGDKLQLVKLDSGAAFIVDNSGTIINAWQGPAPRAQLGELQTGDAGDRPYKLYGLPDRHIHTVSGDYLAYDHPGLALHILNGKIAGWFLYQPEP